MRRPGGRGLEPWTPWSTAPVLTRWTDHQGQGPTGTIAAKGPAGPRSKWPDKCNASTHTDNRPQGGHPPTSLIVTKNFSLHHSHLSLETATQTPESQPVISALHSWNTDDVHNKLLTLKNDSYFLSLFGLRFVSLIYFCGWEFFGHIIRLEKWPNCAGPL